MVQVVNSLQGKVQKLENHEKLASYEKVKSIQKKIIITTNRSGAPKTLPLSPTWLHKKTCSMPPIEIIMIIVNLKFLNRTYFLIDHIMIFAVIIDYLCMHNTVKR